jgi:hypothetical protein
LNDLIDKVLVARGRMGRYEVCDYVLLLNAYAVSGHKSLKEFFFELKPVQDILMSMWRREKCPVASSLSRFLADVDPQAVESLRQIFESNTNQNAIKFSNGLGISDRCGARYAVFDIDGTVCAVRLIDLSDPPDYPIGKRRSSSVAALLLPGTEARGSS